MSATALVRWAEAIRQLPRLVEFAAADIADAIEETVKGTAGDGTTPDGVAWQQTHKGEAPLKNAAKHVDVDVVTGGGRTTVSARVRGHYALHDLGRANGAPRRQILPDSMTPELQKRVQAALEVKFREVVRGDSNGG